MTFRDLSFIVSTLLVFLSVENAAAQHSNASLVFDTYKSAIVNLAVSYLDKKGVPACETGTGFIISNNGYLLTAKHLIQDDDGNIPKTMQIFASVGSSLLLDKIAGPNSLCAPLSTVKGVQLVEVFPTQDVTLMKLPGDTSYGYVPACKQTTVLAGSEIIKIGFPMGTPVAPVIGTVAALDGPQGMWQINLQLFDGDSGSPVFNMSGRLIGLASESVKTAPTLAWIVPLQYFQSLYVTANAPLIDCNTPNGDIEQSGCEPEQVDHAIDFTLADNSKLKETTKPFNSRIQAKAGKVIVDYSWVPNSVNNAIGPEFSLSSDRSFLDMQAFVTSGPLFDRWRGWIHGKLVTKELPKDCYHPN